MSCRYIIRNCNVAHGCCQIGTALIRLHIDMRTLLNTMHTRVGTVELLLCATCGWSMFCRIQ